MRLNFINARQYSWVGVGSLVVSAGVGIYKGIKQKNEAKKQLAGLEGQEVPQALLENKQIASQLANQGLPSEQYAMAQKNIDRQNNLAIMRANSRRAGIGLISKIQQNTNDAYGNLDARNAAMRVSNTGRLMNVNSQIGGIQNKKYQSDYDYAMSLKGAGNQNINNGIDQGIAAVGSGVAGYQRSRRNNGLYGYGGSTSGSYYGTADGGE